MSDIKPLDNNTHKDLRLDTTKIYEHSVDHHATYLQAQEFGFASATYPIAFVKNQDNNQFKPIVMLGLEKNENLFLEDGKWLATYIPGSIRRHPFYMIPRNEELTDWAVCIDENSSALGTEVGDKLFNDDGSPSKITQAVQKFLAEMVEMDHVTNAFCKFLDDNELLKVGNVNDASDKPLVAGVYFVDEERLDNLSDEKMVEVKKRGFLTPIYAHLSSLNKINELFKRKSS